MLRFVDVLLELDTVFVLLAIFLVHSAPLFVLFVHERLVGELILLHLVDHLQVQDFEVVKDGLELIRVVKLKVILVIVLGDVDEVESHELVEPKLPVLVCHL